MSRRPTAILGAALLGVTSLPAQQPVSQVQQYGITWTFAQPVAAGQFANGDWWVHAPVTVVSVSPTPAGGANGSMLNPRAGQALRSGGQGYDSRIPYYQASAAATFPLTMRANDSLVSSIGRPGSTAQPCIYGNTTSQGLLRTAAVLTAVDPNNPPAPGDFRPAYCGPRSGVRFNESQIRWSQLPGLTLTASAPDPRAHARYFERPWLDHLLGYESRYLHPYENMPDYGREIAMVVGEAGLLLLGNRPRSEVRDLMVNYLQVGLDLYGVLQDGHNWWADGGHMNGRKWPVMFAGAMFGDLAMQSPGGNFSEDQQTYFPAGGTGWTGAKALFRMRSSDDHEERTPSTWNSNDISYEKYRRCCTSFAYVGSALCAHIMRMTDAWGHEPFFEYVERWMTPMNTANRNATLAVVGSTVTTFPHEYVTPSFVEDMWWQYRSSYQPTGISVHGQSSRYPIRVAVFDEPRSTQDVDLIISNAPLPLGACMASIGIGPPQRFLNATFLLAGGIPPVALPFTADSSGKAVVRLRMPPFPGLTFAVQLGWLDLLAANADTSQALAFTVR